MDTVLCNGGVLRRISSVATTRSAMGTYLSWQSIQALRISSLPEEQTEKIALCPWLRPSKEIARSRFHWLERQPETIWWVHTQDSQAQWHCPSGADVNSRAPWSPKQPSSLSLPSFGPFLAASSYNHWMASCPSSKAFIAWLQPLISRYPPHLLPYTNHTELISIPPDIPCF